MFVFNLVFVIGIIFPALLSPTDAFHTCWHNGATFTSSKTPSIPRMTRRYPSIPSFSHFAVMSDKQGEEEEGPNLRDKLRKATGFSMTAFRSTWRTATGVSLTAIYASALAASGLWVRRAMSSVLSIFPAWVGNDKRLDVVYVTVSWSLLTTFFSVESFDTFFNRFLFSTMRLSSSWEAWRGPHVETLRQSTNCLLMGGRKLYNLPRKLRRMDTGQLLSPVRKSLLKSLLLQIMPFSLTLVLLLYPIRAEDGDFELKKPPKPDEARFESLPDAVAESVEQAMEQKSSDKA